MKSLYVFLGLIVFGVLLFGGIFLINNNYVPSENRKSFNSYDEIKKFVSNSVAGDMGSYYGRGTAVLEAQTADASGAPSPNAKAADYSTTNIQVAGVDELDIMKNDGKYIYTVNGNKVVITNAYPAEQMEIVSEIDLNNSVQGIFLNGDKLIVFINNYEYSVYEKVMADSFYPRGYSKQEVLIKTYDISDKENPELDDEVSVGGNFIGARMIGDYIYLISSEYINLDNFNPPVYSINGVENVIAARDIIYPGGYDYGYVFTSVSALNVNNGNFESKVFLTGSSWNIYVSENNIYLTRQKMLSAEESLDIYVNEFISKVLPKSEMNKVKDILDLDIESYDKRNKIEIVVRNYFESLTPEELIELKNQMETALENYYEISSKETEKTVIDKLLIDKLDVELVASGEVPGNVLNQFSMDEYKGNFRIATTTGNWRETSLNHLYVLDEDLKIIGSVEDLAKGERIYSTRFMGDRAYMVTFRQVDPLFVIDLSNPSNPEVLGYLKVTGFSSYLHPYDENHIIGIGKEATEEGRALGIKIALFDVSDVENPKEIAKYEVEGDYSDSIALYEHKAFLFDKEKELLVLPMSYQIKTGEVKTEYGYTYPVYEYWNGAFVFNINLEDIELKGKVNHNDNSSENNYQSAVERSLYMDDVLYTISNMKIKANSLDDLGELNEIKLPFEYPDYNFYARPPIAIEG